MISRIDITYQDLPVQSEYQFDGRDLVFDFRENSRTGGVQLQIFESDSMIYSAPLVYASPIMHVVTESPLPNITVLRPEDFSEPFDNAMVVNSDTLGVSVFVYVSDEVNG